MTQGYLNINPIARRLLSEALKLNENKEVDEAIEKLSVQLFDVYKKLIVDFAPEKQRRISTVKEKLKNTANSSTIKEIVAKMKDYSKDQTDLEYSALSDAKDLYLEGMETIADSLKRAIELDPKLQDKAIRYFQDRTTEYVKALSQAYEEEKEEMKELNEGIRMGLKGRVEFLKRKIRKVLIPESKGKDSKNGYGRDWHKIFSELDQKLSVLDHKREISSDRDKKILKGLESQTDKLSKDFYNYCIKAAETPLNKMLSGEEILTKFSEVADIASSAKSILARAAVEEANVEEEMRERAEGHDHKISSLVFPLKIGDNDTDKKFKGSLIIANIQKALMNAFPPIKDLLSKRGGSDGSYTSSFEAAIKSLQGVLGNKNVNGEIDRALLDVILDTDKISRSDKEAITDSLDVLRREYLNESYIVLGEWMLESKIIGASEFFGFVNEASVHIDSERLSSELEKYTKEIPQPETSKGGRSALGYGDRSDNHDQAYELAKLLRSKGFVKGIEEETFLREDGSLRASYSPEFMIAWTKTAEEAKEDKKLPLYFWVEYKGSKIDGLYAAKRLMSTAKRPNNWPKWKEIVGDTDEEDVKEFADWYSSYYSDFGRLDTDSLFSISKNMLSHNRESDEENSKTYDRLYPHFGAKSSKSRYLSSEGMETLKSAFRRGSQIDEKVQDLSESDFGLIANLVALSSTFFTYDKKKEKFVPALKVIFDEILTDEELSKLKSEESLGSSDESSDFVVVLDKKQGIRKANKQDKGSGESRNKKVFEENLKIANLIHLPLLQKHVSRMNAKTWDDLSKDASDGIYKVPSE